MDPLLEQSLIRSVLSGQNTAFGPLYDAYIEDIYRFVFYRVQKKEIAEDITSHIFLKALEKISSYRESKGNFRSWLYTIARNSLTDFYRKNKSTEDIEQVVIIDRESDAKRENALLFEEAKKYLENLSRDQKDIIIMRLWDELSYSEISVILGKSEASCKMMFSRGIKELRKVMPLSLFFLFFFHQ